MKEEETYPLVKRYILNKKLEYMGICNKNKKITSKFNGEQIPVGAEVPVPTIFKEKVYIDHRGHNNGYNLWIECKGSNHGLSKILEGFIRVCYAVSNGAGDGLLCVPHDRIQMIQDNEQFFRDHAQKQSVSKNGRVGILDIQQGKEWFY